MIRDLFYNLFDDFFLIFLFNVLYINIISFES